MRRQRSDISHCHFVNDFGGEKEKKFVEKNEGFKLNDANFGGKSYPFLKTYIVF